MIKIAINGYGRIGRNVLRALYESGRDKTIKIVAINELAAPEAMVHLTRYDTSHGRFHHPVQLAGNSMLVGEDLISLFAERDPSKLPWRALGISRGEYEQLLRRSDVRDDMPQTVPSAS